MIHVNLKGEKIRKVQNGSLVRILKEIEFGAENFSTILGYCIIIIQNLNLKIYFKNPQNKSNRKK